MTIEYLAGFFDGEGSISLKKAGKYPRVLKVQICQKDVVVLEEIKKTFGGWIETGGNVGVPRWVITCAKAKDIAIKMLPYLIVKKEKVSGFVV